MKTVQSVKNSLKFKAQPKGGVLTVKIGVKKYSLPVEARMISGENYLFLSFPACSELFKVDGKTLEPMPSGADASEAYNVLNPGKRRGRRKSSDVQLPSELADALKAIPNGYRLSYGADGSPRLVKTRRRRKGGE